VTVGGGHGIGCCCGSVQIFKGGLTGLSRIVHVVVSGEPTEENAAVDSCTGVPSTRGPEPTWSVPMTGLGLMTAAR